LMRGFIEKVHPGPGLPIHLEYPLQNNCFKKNNYDTSIATLRTI